jgi:hypothetical protein
VHACGVLANFGACVRGMVACVRAREREQCLRAAGRAASSCVRAFLRFCFFVCMLAFVRASVSVCVLACVCARIRVCGRASRGRIAAAPRRPAPPAPAVEAASWHPGHQSRQRPTVGWAPATPCRAAPSPPPRKLEGGGPHLQFAKSRLRPWSTPAARAGPRLRPSARHDRRGGARPPRPHHDDRRGRRFRVLIPRVCFRLGVVCGLGARFKFRRVVEPAGPGQCAGGIDR